jgi:uncharacterized protein YecT (DUF1311 family)
LALALCAAAGAAPVPVWRQDVIHLEADRARVRSCLDAGRGSACADIVQENCRRSLTDDMTGGALRRCDHRAIAAWEDEMGETMARLAAQLSDPTALQDAHAAWLGAMPKDVALATDRFRGGSMAGPAAASARAEAVARRVIWLDALARAED